MLIRFKTMKDRNSCIIDDGSAFIFDSIGNFNREETNLNPRFLDGVLNLPIISILSSRNNVDVMFHFIDDSESYFTSNLSSFNCAAILTQDKDFIKILKRKDKFEGTLFNQVIYVYNQNIDINLKINKLKLVRR